MRHKDGWLVSFFALPALCVYVPKNTLENKCLFSWTTGHSLVLLARARVAKNVSLFTLTNFEKKNHLHTL